MNPIETINSVIVRLKSINAPVHMLNEIILPLVGCINDLAAARDVLVSQQEESHENDHNEERDV
jgi:hypothetical protein